MPVILAAAVILVAAVVINWVQDLKVKRRTNAMQALAERLGLSFAAEAPVGALMGLRDLLLFMQGRPSSKIKNVMRGVYQGVDVAIFDYTFTIPAGRFVENWPQTVVQFHSDALALPRFSLSPRDVLDAVIVNVPVREQREAILGTAGVRFPDHREFSDTYKLMGPRRDKIEARFTDDVIAHFADVDAVCLEGERQYLFYYKMHEVLDADEIEAFLDEGIALFRVLGSTVEEAEL